MNDILKDLLDVIDRTPKLPFADRYILIPAIRDDENELRPATQNFAELLATADDSGVGCVLSEYVPLTNAEGEEVIYTLPQISPWFVRGLWDEEESNG